MRKWALIVSKALYSNQASNMHSLAQSKHYIRIGYTSGISDLHHECEAQVASTTEVLEYNGSRR